MCWKKLLIVFHIRLYVKLCSAVAAILHFRSARKTQTWYRTLKKSFLQSDNSNDTMVMEEKIFKFQPIRMHYWPWRPCLNSHRHEKHKPCRGPPKEHSCQVWFHWPILRGEDWNVESWRRRRTQSDDKSSHGLLGQVNWKFDYLLRYLC